jgi:uncharacterized protein (DUF1501 family)
VISRRQFMNIAARAGLTAASAPLWLHETSARAFAQLTGGYKAIVVVTLVGGNDGNNMIIPMDAARYTEYASLRSRLAIPLAYCRPMLPSDSNGLYGFHPSLANVSSLYNRGKALAVANIGPISRPVNKAILASLPALFPEGLLAHPAGAAQWESASTVALPDTGWGGRIADLIASQSGSLPPLFDAGPASIFTVGRSVQGIAVQSGSASFSVVPSALSSVILSIAQNDSSSSNNLVAQAAQLRVNAMQQQALLAQAQNAGMPFKTQFPQTSFGQTLSTIAQIINGRSVIGASRQIFYGQQGQYDTHGSQLQTHASYLSDFDDAVGAFLSALQEVGLQDSVLICTHSDFNRTLVGNASGGTDHAWGNHQLVIGGGIRGGRIIGSIPDPELGGSLDLNGYGTWIPTLSVTQMTAAVGQWMGLTNTQLATVFPDLANFPNNSVTLN